jgi:hypothetical protein
VRIIAVTRLRFRSILFLPSAWWQIKKLQRCLEKAPGFLMGRLLADRNRTFWTMTMWKDIDSMRAFRNSRPHAAVIRKAAQWCDEACFVHWETQADELPGWDEAHRRLSESGKPSPLKFPSEEYKAGRYKQPYRNKGNCLVALPRK